MVLRNPNIAKLQAGYLFPEIAKHKNALLKEDPSAQLISLGIGDTTEPVPASIAVGLSAAARNLGTPEGYSGYGDEGGTTALRTKIAEELYGGKISPNEVFVSDGAKCDIGRLQVLFGTDCTVAVQDPSYPAYVDTAVIMGQTGDHDGATEQYKNIVYMPCKPENNFFPDLSKTPRTDIIFFCSPNNPTGAVATRQQLEELVTFAKKNKSIIVFDAAYSEFIQDPSLPKSIYEIEGAEEIAIETNSFSKIAGFTGVRLGWSVVPKALKYDDGSSVHQDWNRVCSTFFNGASNIAQAGGIACLEEEGVSETRKLVDYYLNNAKKLREGLKKLGFECYGGDNAPYIWIHFPGEKSWDVFGKILQEAHIITTPGVGFGPCGENFVRISAFGKAEDIDEAIQRLTKLFKKALV